MSVRLAIDLGHWGLVVVRAIVGATLDVWRVSVRLAIDLGHWGLVVVRAIVGATLDVWRFFLRLGPVEWLLLVVGGVMVWRQLSLLWLRLEQADPSEVADLEDGSVDAKLPTKSLTALLRDRLAASGLLPPSAVPGLSLEQGLVSVVQTSPLTQAKFVGGLLSFIWDWSHPKTGHRVAGTLWQGAEDPKCRISVTVTNTATGAAVAIHTLGRDSFEKAVEDAADYAFQEIQADSRPRVRVWRQWRSVEASALGRYRKGEGYEKGGKETDLPNALAEYRAAAELEPGNAIVRLRRSDVFEKQRCWIDAMTAYLAIIRFWPELRLPRYRLGSIFTVANLPALWDRLERDRRDELVTLMAAVRPTNPPMPNDQNGLRRWFLEQSDHQLTALLEGSVASEKPGVKKVNWFGQRLRRFPSRDPEGVGRLFEKAVCVARCCTRLDLELFDRRHPGVGDGGKPSLESLRKEADRRANELEGFFPRWRDFGWKAHYNAACFYSIAMALSDRSASDGWVDKQAKTALWHLERVVQDPDSAKLAIDWLLSGDPDLEALRGHPAFRAWASFLMVSSTPRRAVGSCERKEAAMAGGSGFQRRFATLAPTASEQLIRHHGFRANQTFEPLPEPVGAYPYRLDLEAVVGLEAVNAILGAGQISFHVLGDTGGVKYPASQQIVAMHMEEDYHRDPMHPPAFCYILGDLIYYHGERSQYYPQFYEPYSQYGAPIMAIPGNHDGDPLDPSVEPSLSAFVDNFCAPRPHVTKEAEEVQRDAMTQPNVFWTLTAPFVTMIGLYTNVPEGGRLDDEQVAWLHSELTAASNQGAVIVTMHHPIYSMDQLHGGSAYMGSVLDAAMASSGRRPDLVLTGHVHNYQRFTRQIAEAQLPYLVSGAGGYWHLHYMARDGAGNPLPQGTPWPVPGTDVTLENYRDDRHGFLRLTASPEWLRGAYTTVPRPHESWRHGRVEEADTFTVNLATHTVG